MLSRTLGPEFYSPESLDPVIAEDEDELEPDANRDVTPERFSKLEKELVRGKSEVVSMSLIVLLINHAH